MSGTLPYGIGSRPLLYIPRLMVLRAWCVLSWKFLTCIFDIKVIIMNLFALGVTGWRPGRIRCTPSHCLTIVGVRISTEVKQLLEVIYNMSHVCSN